MTTFRSTSLLVLVLFCVAASAYAQEDRVRRRGRQFDNQDEQQRRERPSNQPGNQPAQPSPDAIVEVGGKLVDSQTGDPLIGANVRVEDQMIGAVTGVEGEFDFRLREPARELTLVVTMIGYQQKKITVQKGELPLNLALEPDFLSVDEIVVAASRKSERLAESPVTIETMNIQDIQRNPSLNMYEGLTQLKGVDQLSSSITFRTINTRGFNSRTNPRMVYRQDGMDMQAPGLNIPIGILNGAPDIDIASVEVIPGAASALYGANAFNGMVITRTKDPFNYPGVSARVKMGVNHVNSPAINEPQPLYEAQFRVAKSWNNRFGFKLVGNFLRATDWVADDFSNEADYSGNLVNDAPFIDTLMRNPGYNGVNIYGDEVAQVFTPENTDFGLFSLMDTATFISRNGYRELPLRNDRAGVMGGSAGLYYNITPEMQASVVSQVGTGSTIYSAANRYQIDNFLTHYHRAEVKHDNFFVRAYASFEDAGDSYDTRFAGIQSLRAMKSDDAWFNQYLFAYNQNTNNFLNNIIASNPAYLERYGVIAANDHDAARAFANSNNQILSDSTTQTLLELGPLLGLDQQAALALANDLTSGEAFLHPDSERFQEILDSVTAVPLNQNGAQFIDRTWFWHTEAQYDFSHLLNGFMDLTAGGSFRQFRMNSDGVIFIDSTSEELSVWEYGFYAQARKRFFDERLTLTVSGRIDQMENFDPVPSPRAAAVLALGSKRNHFIRSSFQSAFRNPTLQAQYIDFDVQVFRYLGGLEQIDRGYALTLEEQPNNAYTQTSVQAYLESVAADSNGVGDSTLLERYELRDITPERLNSWEIGYRGFLGDWLSYDIVYYYNQYQDFTETDIVVGPDLQRAGTEGELLTPEDIRNREYSTFSRYANRTGENIDAHGVNVGVNIAVNRHLSLNGTYAYAALFLDREEQIERNISFNTPEHKATAGITLTDLPKNVTVGFNYRYVEAYLYNEDLNANIIPTFHTLDGQISYKVPAIKTIFRIGGTNLLNHYFREQFAGPRLGGLYYFQISFDEFLN